MAEILVPVTAIETRGESVLVEYQQDGIRRCIIPSKLIKDGVADADTLSMGIPYGLPWDELINLKATPAALANELRIRGIWTIEDMRRNQPVVFGALQAVYGLDLAALFVAAETYVTGR